MKRRKENQTRVEHNGVTWTVEFILTEGRKLSPMEEAKTLGEAWDFANAPQKSSGKRRRSSREALPQKKRRSDEPNEMRPLADEPTQFFYLLRPNTPSKIKVLCPIDRKQNLVEILRDRTVLEYPTIYVKDEPPDQLQPPFLLEAKYLAEHGEDVIPMVAAEEGEIQEEKIGEIFEALQDPSKLRSVLQADLA